MGTRYELFDDLDETLDADTTATFSLQGESYEIDLSNQNFQKLKTALEPFIKAGRKLNRSAPSPRIGGGAKKQRTTAKPELDAIRFWAGRNGYTVSDKGRIPVDVQAAYDKAHAPARKETAAVSSPQFSGAGK